MHHLFQALATTTDGAFVINRQNDVIFWNRAAERLLGYTAEEAGRLPCYQVLAGVDEAGRTLCRLYCSLSIAGDRRQPAPTIDVYALTRDGLRRWISLTTLAFPSGNEEIGNVIVHLFRDAAEKKSREAFVDQVLSASRQLHQHNGHGPVAASASVDNTNPLWAKLTPREQEVLLLLGHGLGTEGIADRLSISPATTSNHIQSVLDKLNVHSRLEAVAYAYQQGFMSGDGSGWTPNRTNAPQK